MFPGRPGPDALFEAIDRYRPSLFFAVPTLYAAMLQVEAATARYDLSSLRVCVSAGEALPSEIFKRWRERFGLEIVDGIGSSPHLHLESSGRLPSRHDGPRGAGVREDRRR